MEDAFVKKDILEKIAHKKLAIVKIMEFV